MLWKTLEPRRAAPFGLSMMHSSTPPAAATRARFLFSNKLAQQAEARLNLDEALRHCVRVAPPPVIEPEAETTEAGRCFREVTRLLKGKGARR